MASILRQLVIVSLASSALAGGPLPDRGVLYKVRGRRAGEEFGGYLGLIEDLDGDRLRDLVVRGCSPILSIHSSVTGSLLVEIDTSEEFPLAPYPGVSIAKGSGDSQGKRRTFFCFSS